MTAATNRRAVLGAMLGAGVASATAASGAATLSARDAAIAERVRHRYCQPGTFERGLAILKQEAEGREERAAIAKRIGGLVLEREANQKALEAAVATFDLPPTPRELVVTYRGPFGSMLVEVDPDWLREMIPGLSPRSRRGRQLRRLLRIHEEHYARMWADREASGMGPLIREREQIERDLKAAADEVCDLEGSGAAHVALQAATLLVKGMA
jgi:hypothetical protein